MSADQNVFKGEVHFQFSSTLYFKVPSSFIPIPDQRLFSARQIIGIGRNFIKTCFHQLDPKTALRSLDLLNDMEMGNLRFSLDKMTTGIPNRVIFSNSYSKEPLDEKEPQKSDLFEKTFRI